MYELYFIVSLNKLIDYRQKIEPLVSYSYAECFELILETWHCVLLILMALKEIACDVPQYVALDESVC